MPSIRFYRSSQQSGYPFMSGKGKDEIAAELKSAFITSDTQAVKITRRVLGRARFFQRALSLVTAK